MLSLSVLDQSPVRQGVTPRDALMETIELARHVETLGYRRYWLAEHHATPALAGSAPEILIARVAAETSHIRVGSGGVMLSRITSSLKVAEQFRMLRRRSTPAASISASAARRAATSSPRPALGSTGQERSASSISPTRSPI